MKANRGRFGVALGLMSLGAVSSINCGGLEEGALEGDDVESQSSAILAGMDVPADALGVVLIGSKNSVTNGKTICSGTVVSPFWALTSHKCVTKGGLRAGGTQVSPASLSVQLKGGTPINVVQIVRHPTLDVALLQLNSSLTQAGGAPFPNKMRRASTVSLSGQTVFCEGWGANSTSGTGGSMLRSATLTPGNLSTGFFSTVANTSGQTMAKGDEGAPCFSTVADGRKRIAGIVTSTTTSPPVATFVGSETVRDWIAAVMGNAATPSSPGGYERADGITSIIYRNADTAHPIELCFGGACGASWSRADFTTLFGAPNVKGLLFPYVRADGVNAFVWRGNDNNIMEVNLTSTWNVVNITRDHLGLNGFAASDPSAYVRNDFVTSIVYAGTDGHIHEAYKVGTSASWFDGDLTNAAGGLGVAPTGTNPIGFIRADGLNSVVYLAGTDIIELRLTATSAFAPDDYMCPSGTAGWVALNLTTATGAPPAFSPPRPYSRGDGVTAIVYRSTGDRIIELALTSYDWKSNDLGTGFSAPVPYVREDGVSGVLYLDSSSQLSTLELPAVNNFTGPWTRTNLTTATGSVNPFSFNSAPFGAAFTRADGATEVVFQGSNKHVYGIKHTPTGWVKDTANSTTGDLTPNGH